MSFRAADLRGVRALLCDADGNLFGSEEPAFVASADVTNRFLAELGVDRRYGAEELRLAATGRNFRSTALLLAVEHGVALDADLAAGRDDHDAVADRGDGRAVLTAAALGEWVLEEQRAVQAYLADHLRPDDAVTRPLERMAERYVVAAVSSSATPRLRACFGATDLEGLFVPERTFSAEDSLPRPTSKPDPAIYRFAAETLGLDPAQGLAVEDSVTGARSAVGAGCPTLGNVQFVAEDERAERIAALRDAGVLAVVTGWDVVERLLADGAVPAPA